MRSRYPSKRLFKSDALEMLTHVHPVVPLLIWGPTTAFFIWKALHYRHIPVSSVVVMMAAGVFAWTLTEYLVHRFIFHFPARSAFSKAFVYFVHELHHEQPDDPTRLVLPPFFSIVLGFVFYFLYQAVLGEIWVDAFFPGYIVGYLAYDYTHFATHHFRPMTAWGRWIKQNHMLHHFGSPDRKIGVSSPLWDFVFGTFRESRVPRSSKSHKLP